MGDQQSEFRNGGSRPSLTVEREIGAHRSAESGDALNSYVDGSNEKKGEWFPLVDDAEQLNWRFFDGQAEKWTSDWPNPSTKPSLVELTFKLAGRRSSGTLRLPVADGSNWIQSSRLEMAYIFRDENRLAARRKERIIPYLFPLSPIWCCS